MTTTPGRRVAAFTEMQQPGDYCAQPYWHGYCAQPYWHGYLDEGNVWRQL